MAEGEGPLRIRPFLLLTFLLGAASLVAPVEMRSADSTSTPNEISFCQLSRDPAAYNHDLIRITAFVTHAFEDFHLVEPDCPTQGFSVWVTYGGKVQSNTVYCCPGESGKGTRSEVLEVEDVQIPLVDDSKFRLLTNLLKREPDTTVRVTLVGKFFSGEKQKLNGQTFWGGAGHFGCCSLFVIQQVESVAPHNRRDLDYFAEAGWYEKEDCQFGTLRDRKHVSLSFPGNETIHAINDQIRADKGEAPWLFTDPKRVAMESLKDVYPGEIPLLHNVKKTSEREVFRWRKGKDRVVVVVTRPYWLSFYANSESVAWVTTMIKQAGCN
jgi:hypothetical protein